MRKVGFFIGYGLLPFWAASALVFIGGLFERSSDYWNAAPWLIVFSIPVCGATLLVSIITLIVHVRATGDPSHKKTVATKAFWVLNLVLIAIAGMWWMRSAMVKRDIDNEKERVMDYVRSHDTVVQRFGTSAHLSIVSSTMNPATGPLPHKYEVSIGTKPFESSNFAIVSVKETAGQRYLVLDCITPTPMGYRDSFKDPCKQ